MNTFVLSKEQENAATSSSDRLMIVAPPGCGKTEVLAHRAAYLIDSLEKNQRILALTFTNRARSNLEERLRAVLGQAKTHQRILVQNFHSFATRLTFAHGRTIGLKVEELKRPQKTTLKKAIEEAGGSGNVIYEVERMLGEVKRHPFSDIQVLEKLQQYPRGEERELAEEVERARQQASQLHYDDLLRHAQCLLHIPAVARLYQAHFGAVLVDEFQDLSLQQLDLARLSCTSQQTFAGDLLQGIYSWAGAAPVKVEAEIRKDCAEPIHLHESYRSSPKVLETVNSVSERIDSESSLISAHPEQWLNGGCSATLVIENRAKEAEVLSDLANEILRRHPQASVGIICRSKWRRKDLDQVFEKTTHFPVRRWDLALDEPKVISLIHSTIATLPRDASIEDARLATLDAVDPADVETLEQIDDAFERLKESNAKTAKAAAHSIKISNPKQTIGPGVHLLNAHTGKGQQFDWVFVIGLEEGHLPDKRSSRGQALAEEERVLLVMLSRARYGLIVTRIKTNNGKYGPYSAEESRWWSKLRTDYTSKSQIEQHLRMYLDQTK